MTDLELLDKYCETCLDFIHPIILRDVTDRGLYHVINFLPNTTIEAKAVVRARLAKMGKCFGDAEIDQIAGEIHRLEFLRKKLDGLNIADVHKVIPILEEMRQVSDFILNYYKPNKQL